MKKTYLYGAAAFGLLFTSCSSDDLTTDKNVVSNDGARTFYVNLNIRGDVAGNETRAAVDNGNPTATDFSDGESDVRNAFFVFYDNNGNQVGGEPVPVDLSSANWIVETVDNSVEKYYQSTVGVTVQNGEENPTQVICYLNPQEASSLTKPLSEIETQTRPNLKTDIDNKSYFSMSNSVFYTSTASEAPQIAVQIAPNQLFNSESAAKNALNDASLTVNIHVERYAAKLSFKSKDPNDYITVTRPINNGESGNQVTLSFKPITWILNASCAETYVVKSFREEDASSGAVLNDNYGYNELNDIINRAVDGIKSDWQWNSTNYKRSYWAMSPAYFTAEYPEVSSDVANIKTLHQKYFTYNELIQSTVQSTGTVKTPKDGFTVSTSNPVTEYVHETTVGRKALTSKNIVAALPSIILVGDYTIKVGSTTLPDYTTFFTYGIVSSTDNRPLVYFEDQPESQTGESAIAGGESMLRGFLKAATCLYKKVGDGYENFDLTDQSEIQKLVAVFEVAIPSNDVKGNLKVPERYRTLQLREGVTQEQLDGIYVGTTEGYKSIIADPTVTTPGESELTLLGTNQELMKVVGYCAEYNAGAAYFNIPVKHFGWYRDNNVNKDAENINWTKVRVGDFGIVRNHTYNVAVDAIVGIGTGIGGKDNPIVPPSQENKYYIAYSVNILKWAVVPTQSVTL